MSEIQTIGIVGAGAMGRGIAQIAAQAGVLVRLYDTNAAAVQAARDALRQTWDKLAQKGKLSEADAQAALARIAPAAALADLADCQLVIEAVIERLDVKRDLFAALEEIVAADCVLASNTSSLSITAIAAACKRPQRVVGYHFFNPVPLMKVVEVIDGLRSDPAVGDALAELARRMGHTPVRAKDMPGFIVNHAGRGMNTEGLRVAQEAVAPFDQIDAIMREQAGFRMGPFELLDLTALDVSHPVMESIYRQFFDEPRFRPSPITTVRLAGGLIGRKAGEGFYAYPDGQKQVPAEPAAPVLRAGLRAWVSPAHPDGHARASALLRGMAVELAEGGNAAAGCADHRHALRRGCLHLRARPGPGRRAHRGPGHAVCVRGRPAPHAHGLAGHGVELARRRPCAGGQRRCAGQRHRGFARFRGAAHRRLHRQHCQRYRAAAHRHAAGYRSRRDAGPGLPGRAAGAGRQAGRRPPAGDPAQHAARHR